MIRFPFTRELSALFASDRHAIWKILGSGGVGALLGARAAFGRDSDWSTSAAILITLVVAALAIIVVAVLLLRDVAHHRVAAGQQVNPLLKWYLCKGALSATLWIMTALALVIAFAALTV